MELKVLYRDEDCIAIVKPSGLLVHRSSLAHGETQFAVQILRDQIGQNVFTVHRLDRPTSGVMLFALNSGFANQLAEMFAERKIEKTYLAVVRGVPPEEALIEHPIKEELDPYGDPFASPDKEAKEAITFVKRLATIEFPVQVDRYPTSRYSLVRANPKTGRRHQIRRHLRHLGHPIIGDVNHGVGKHNRYFAEAHGVKRLLLACTELKFQHPKTQKEVQITAPLCDDFTELVNKLDWAKNL